MELKVNVDGIQRIVSGVTNSTTCQDVVFALAHACRQTGRFTLLEKWRNNERLLAPQEHPMEVLKNWGEYSSDVQFVMKRSSPITAKLSPQQQLPEKRNSKEPSLPTSSQQHMTPQSTKSQINSSSVRDHKKSPFNCTNKSPLSPDSRIDNNPMRESNANFANTSHDNVDETRNNNVFSNELANETVFMKRPKHPPPYNEAIAKSSLLGSTNKSKPSHTSSPNNSYQHQAADERENNNKRHIENTMQPKIMSGELSQPEIKDQKQMKTNKSLVGKMQQRHNHQNYQSQQNEGLHRDAIRLIGLQRETMQTQQQELMDLDSELLSWEKKVKEEDEPAFKLETEIKHMERIWIEQEAQREKLEQQNLEEELAKLKDEANDLEKNKMLMLSQMNSYDSQIASNRQKIENLIKDIKDQELAKEKKEQKKKENENEKEKQLAVLRFQIKEQVIEFEKNSEELKIMQEELYNLDQMINGKMKEIEAFMNEIKEANLQGLSFCKPDELKRYINHNGHSSSPEVSNGFNGFFNRPGSTRRMIGSPRQLESAVPTSKNPHGVWV